MIKSEKEEWRNTRNISSLPWFSNNGVHPTNSYRAIANYTWNKRLSNGEILHNYLTTNPPLYECVCFTFVSRLRLHLTRAILFLHRPYGIRRHVSPRDTHGVPPLNDRRSTCSPEEEKKKQKKKKKEEEEAEWRKENPRNVIVLGFVYKDIYIRIWEAERLAGLLSIVGGEFIHVVTRIRDLVILVGECNVLLSPLFLPWLFLLQEFQFLF